MQRTFALSVALATTLFATDSLEPVTVTASGETLPGNLALELAKDEPGVDMRRTTGKPQEITIHGLGGEDLSVTGEGAATHGACPNRMDPPLAHMNTAKIDGYEITKGPYNVRQIGVLGGSAEVRFKPVPAQTVFEAEAGAASYDRRDLSIYGGGGNGTFGIAAGVQRNESGVYKDGDGNYATNDATPAYKAGIEDEKAYDKQGVFVQAGFKAGGVKTAVEYDTITTDHALFPNRPMDETQTDTTQTALTIEGVEGALEGLKLKAYQNNVEHVMDNYTFRTTADAMKTDAKGTSTVSGLRLSKSFERNGRGFEVGLEQMTRAWEIGRYAALTGALKSNGQMIDAQTTLLGLYAVAEIPMKQDCKLEVGLRADSVEIKDSNPNGTNMIEAIGNSYTDSIDDTLVAAYIKRTQTFQNGWNFVAGLGTAQRPLAPNEAYIQQANGMGTMPSGVQGNPDLKSPSNTQIDLGGDFKGEALSFKGNVYYALLKDYVYETKVNTSNKTYTNIDATMMGLDVSARYRISNELSLKAMVAWQQAEKDKADNGSKDLAGIPPLRGGLHALYEAAGWKASLELEASAKDSDIDENLGEVEMKSYSVVNLRGEMTVAKGVTLLAGVENLFDKAYAQYNAYSPDPINGAVSVLPEPGRTLYASVKYRY
ncbi:MAG: TonB-dependent receptor [Campylobacterales bacterium]